MCKKKETNNSTLTRIVKKIKRNKETWVRPLCTIVLVFLILIFGWSVFNSRVFESSKNRTLDELNSTSQMQSDMLETNLNQQLQPLQLVADMLENGRHFTSEKIQPTLYSIIRTYNLKTLAMVDSEGETIKCFGKRIGNISDYECFKKTMKGGNSSYYQYLDSSKYSESPTVMFTMRAYDTEGNLVGILVGCKSVKDLEKAIFVSNTLSKSASGIILGDNSGKLITANEMAYNYIDKTQASQENQSDKVDKWKIRLSKMKGDEARTFYFDDVQYFVACKTFGSTKWRIYSITTGEHAIVEKKSMILTVAVIILIFAILIIYIVILDWINLARKNREVSLIKQYNENYKNILSETHCAIVEYDVDTETIVTLQENFGDLNLGMLSGTEDNYEAYKHEHPEFDFEELEAEIDIAKKNGRTCAFETLLSPDHENFYWLKTKLIPIKDENDELIRIYCVLFDVSDIHKEHETIWDTYAGMPGAVNRHILSKPIHINYYSDGLCKLLGYTRTEIDKIISDDHLYSLLIYEEDRPKFISFLNNMAKDGGMENCEYRLICKDGTLLDVADTMDAKRGSSGIMYGYSVITNIGKYRKEQHELVRELAQTRKQLSDSRLKIAGSQMQPHFLYNALSSIREIVLENPTYAADLIYDFTTHLRACIRSMSSDSLVPFSQEFENIQAYVNIEKMRFGDRLLVEYDCPERDFDVIPLSVQPLVENSIRHGIFNRGETGGKVTVRTACENNYAIITVEDNGTGFDFEETMKDVELGTRDSNGLANLIFRFETLLDADVSVESKINYGTKITIKIPMHEAKENGEK